MQDTDLAEVRIRNAGCRGFSFRDLLIGVYGFLMALLLIGTIAITRLGYLTGLVFRHSPAQLGQSIDGAYLPKHAVPPPVHPVFPEKAL